MNKKLLCLALGAAFVTGTAQADLLQRNSASFGPSTTDINQQLILQQFNDGGGTMVLHGASLLITTTFTSSTSLLNTAAQAQTFSYDASLTFLHTETSGAFSLPSSGQQVILATTGGFVTLASGASLDLGSTSGGTEGSEFSYTPDEATDHPDLSLHDGVFSITHAVESYNINGLGLNTAALTGSGTFNVGCQTFTGSSFLGGGGNIDLTQSTVAGCTAEVVYHYDNVAVTPNPPVPEPTALALLGLSIAGLGFSRRKAK